MPVPIACPVSLSTDEHTQLELLVRAHSTPQALAFRCASSSGLLRPSNHQIRR